MNYFYTVKSELYRCAAWDTHNFTVDLADSIPQGAKTNDQRQAHQSLVHLIITIQALSPLRKNVE